MRFRMRSVLCLALCAVVAGCGTDYCWRSSVPEAVRTVAVPTFRNESDVSELGALASRQLLREFQREGTFKIKTVGNAVLEIQGTIKSAKAGIGAYDRRSGMRTGAYNFSAVATVTVIDRRTNKLLMENRSFSAQTTFSTGQDLTTAQRDASGRLMDDLARQVVDAVLNIKW